MTNVAIAEMRRDAVHFAHPEQGNCRTLIKTLQNGTKDKITELSDVVNYPE